ncbi:hypothetical protein QYM36_000120 [Artemia franciscana]|uniref:Rab-GAP TBC domain-containing protein n=1 Tax=Artemia franciscana TaxID=6661 RepID=A0AA88LIZ1_ARTSF|nr:hypothetical protein QYM36_000120 [Artemia franciscana]
MCRLFRGLRNIIMKIPNQIRRLARRVKKKDEHLDSIPSDCDSQQLVQPPVSKEEFENYFSNVGTSEENSLALRCEIYKRGLANDCRRQAWEFLLGYDFWNAPSAERDERRKKLGEEYLELKKLWLSLDDQAEKKLSSYDKYKTVIKIDLRRLLDNDDIADTSYNILMTYLMYNYSFGYYQGMSDILIVILKIIEDETAAFWCFSRVMTVWRNNFDLEEFHQIKRLKDLARLLKFTDPKFYKYLKSNNCDDFKFYHQHLMVLFQREFVFEEILRLWDCFFACIPAPGEQIPPRSLPRNFDVLFALAIFNKEKSNIMDQKLDENDILQYFNRLAGNMDVDALLKKARNYYRTFLANPVIPCEIQDILNLSVCEDEDSDGFVLL